MDLASDLRSNRRKLQAHRKCRRIALSRFRRSQDEMFAAAPEDPVILIAGVTFALHRVRNGGINAVGKAVLEIHLRGELKRSLGAGCRSDFNVNVHCPALVPTGVYRDKSGLAV